MIEKHVTSLELSKELNTLLTKKGVKVPKSMFIWRGVSDNTGEKPYWSWSICQIGEDLKILETQYQFFPAYLSSELGEMLPVKYDVKKVGIDGWFCYKQYGKKKLLITNIMGEILETTEPYARCKLLIYLLKNNLITNV